MVSPYLIAHKVRGEAAFDVAIRCDDMGTDSDPGPWWIIPTSGHRAYPLMHWALSSLGYHFPRADCSFDFAHLTDDTGPLAVHPDFANLPDHYSNTRSHEPAPRKDPRQILASLGLYKPVIINRRL